MHPGKPDMHVSHETIYVSLFVPSRGVLDKGLISRLRRRRTMRRAKRASTAGQRRGQIVNAVSIHDRPKVVEDRAVPPGHWEGDLLTGAGNSHVATLVERQSRFVMLVRIAGKDTGNVVRALTGRIRLLPPGLMASLTWDRGTELAAHQAFSTATGVPVYSCDPQSPWQRGSNENTNGLLRRSFPEGTNLATLTQSALDVTARRLNTRPRKVLDYDAPVERLAAPVALTA